MSSWTEERPSEDFYRILEPDGSLGGEPPALDDETLLAFYRTFVRTRTFEQKSLAMQRRGDISIIARSTGEEATPLGTAAALAPGDWCFPTYRQQSALFYWEIPMARVFATLAGAAPETIDEHLPVEEPPAVNFTPGYVPLGVNVTNAVGSAMTDAFNDRETVTMAYIGEGSTSEGDFHEAMNFAGVFDVPAVIICQNNQWAISVPAHRQTASETFAQKAAAYGIPSERVDGNDVLAVYEKTKDAVERARAGDGPTFIECVTYRLAEHNTADESSVYRNDDQYEYWQARDPVDRYETFLQEKGLLDAAEIEAIETAAAEQVETAARAARNMPRSDPQRMFDNHLHAETWHEAHQRAELEREQQGRNPFVDHTGEGFE